jgi:hypothetical protein
MTEFETAMRHYCRNPRCRMKLPAPVSNPREAFCTRGCHTSFHLHRCLVCEAPMERKTERQLICGKRLCRNALQARSDLGRYHVSSGTVSRSKTIDSIGLKPAVKAGRATVWRVVAAGAPITANQYHCAIVGAEQATTEADRINAAHWRAAKAGDRGYRRPDAPTPNTSRPALVVPTIAAVIPADLSIPAFLRRPLPRPEPERIAA